MKRHSSVVAAALFLGCSSPRPPATEPHAPSVAVPPANESRAETPPTAPESPAAPSEVREPTELGCRISSTSWDSDQLRLRADGPRFARVSDAPSSVLLPVVAKPTEAIAVMDDGLVVLRAVLPVGNVALYAPKPTRLLGIVTPAADTVLEWTSSTAGSVRVALGTSALRMPQPFVADVTCAELAIVPSEYDARASITKRKNLAKREVVTDGAPIAPEPKAAAVAELNHGVEVELLELRGARARILIDDLSYLVSGWVAQKDLGPPTLRAALGHGGSGGQRGRGISQLVLLHCPAERALFVQLGAERVKAGSIRKDAGFRLMPKSDADPAGFRSIELPAQQWLELEKTARLLVDEAGLDACREDSHRF